MLKAGVSYHVQLFEGVHGREVGEHVGDTALVVLTKDDVEGTRPPGGSRAAPLRRSATRPIGVVKSSAPSPDRSFQQSPPKSSWTFSRVVYELRVSL